MHCPTRSEAGDPRIGRPLPVLITLLAQGIERTTAPARVLYPASPTTMSGAAGVLELIGGVLIILGLFTRPVAFILSGMCAVAYFYAHYPRGLYPILNGGELAALYSFVFLYLASAGGGAWSLDRARGAQ
jgi:putative oxidoreductase